MRDEPPVAFGIGVLVGALFMAGGWFLTVRDHELEGFMRGRSRGYAAAVDSVRAARPQLLTRDMLTPGVMAARALEAYGVSYTISVLGWDSDTTRTVIHVGDFGEARR